MKAARAITDMGEATRDVADALKTLREALAPVDGTPQDYALCAIETFCDISIRVMRKVNPSKIRDEARTVETKARLDGIPFLELSNVKAATTTGE